MSNATIANLQNMKNRWLAVVESHKIGDQLDGDFGILDDAINAIRNAENEIATLKAVIASRQPGQLS